MEKLKESEMDFINNSSPALQATKAGQRLGMFERSLPILYAKTNGFCSAVKDTWISIESSGLSLESILPAISQNEKAMSLKAICSAYFNQVQPPVPAIVKVRMRVDIYDKSFSTIIESFRSDPVEMTDDFESVVVLKDCDIAEKYAGYPIDGSWEIWTDQDNVNFSFDVYQILTCLKYI